MAVLNGATVDLSDITSSARAEPKRLLFVIFCFLCVTKACGTLTLKYSPCSLYIWIQS